jgi:hypothetical protein
MPLRDHFRSHLRDELEWHSFQNAWATTITFGLNPLLPSGFRASPNVQTGIAIDVATFGSVNTPAQDGSPNAWQPESATATVPITLASDTAEVLVHGYRDGRYLAGAIELVSEGNKDLAESREAFVTKCEAYLQNGVGVVIVDPVTTRTANLHDELLTRIGHTQTVWGERLDVTAYQPYGSNGSSRLNIWQHAVTIGSELPTMPLWLLHGPCVPLALETSYEETFRQLRLPIA